MLAHGQQSGPVSLEAAVQQLDKASAVKDYEVLAGVFGQLTQAHPADWLPWYYAAYCNTRIAYLYRETPERITSYAERAMVLVDKAKALLTAGTSSRALSEVLCISSWAQRAMILVSPIKNGRRYSGLSAEDAAKAKQLAPDNPRAWYMEALGKYYTPVLFGGDKDKARQLCREALRLLEASSGNRRAPHWGRADVMRLLQAS
ncbi:hypothetical protein CK934_24000 [Chitinophaga sp. MD30]|nr:hypothetical protein CK934_24000 [Chitinophaga sp. MD30]